ncbi:hypothetical protein [Methanosarcina acetivorans]|nr:hypothetical protein [Methanosarcina acetivorans]
MDELIPKLKIGSQDLESEIVNHVTDNENNSEILTDAGIKYVLG